MTLLPQPPTATPPNGGGGWDLGWIKYFSTLTNFLTELADNVYTLINVTFPALVPALSGLIQSFYATSTPTAREPGDIWFNPNNNQLQRWDGTAWEVISTLGADFSTNITGQINQGNIATYMANLAVNTPQIANNAVTLSAGAAGPGTIAITVNSQGYPALVIASVESPYLATGTNSLTASNGSISLTSYSQILIKFLSSTSTSNVTYTYVSDTTYGAFTCDIVVLVLKK